MKKTITLILIVLSLSKPVYSQNVGINSSGAAPAASAMLDIDVSTLGATAKKGFLMPRIPLSSVTDVATIPSPATSLMVYNTTAASTGTNAVFPGYYYFDGTVWVAFSGVGSKDWALLGNAGTVAGTNFLGTTDNVDLMFKSNNVKSGLINNASNITLFGYQAGLATTGTSNSFFGVNTGIINTTGLSNTGMGYNSLSKSNSSYNTAIGVTTLFNLTSGGSNTFMGVSSGYYHTTGSGNTGFGMYAAEGGNGTAAGSYNTAIGFAAGSGFSGGINYLPITTGSYNSFIGYNTALSAGTFTSASAIGANALAGANDVLILGSITGTNGATADTKVGIGITTPTTALHVVETAALQAIQIDESNGGNALLINESGNGSGIFATENGNGSGIAIISNDDGGGFTLTQQGVVTTSNTAAYIENTSTTSTVGLLRKGLDVVSKTLWTAASATNIGLSVDVTSAGSSTNLAAMFMGGNVGIGTPTPGGQFELSSDQGRKPSTNTWTIVSDERLKTIHGLYNKGLAEILKLNPITYNYKNVGSRVFEEAVLNTTAVGFSAQEVQKIFPEAVGTDKDGYLNFNMHAILVAYTNAIKEQQVMIDELKSTVKEFNTLKSELEALKAQVKSLSKQ